MRTNKRRVINGLPVRSALVKLLRERKQPMFCSDIAQALGMPVNRLHAYLLTAMKHRQVKQVRRGVYEAADEHQ